MKQLLLSMMLLLLAATSCSKEDTPLPPEETPVKLINYCTIVDNGTDGFILHSDSSPLYVQFFMDSPVLREIVESGTRRVYGVFVMPPSFDRNLINKTDTVFVAGATITQIAAIDTHPVLTSGEAETLGLTSLDNTFETAEVSATACRGFITVTGVYGHLVSNEGMLPVNVHMYIDEVHSSSDVLALRLVYTRNEIDGYDKLQYLTRTDCYALQSLKERYGSRDRVTVEIHTRNKVITTLNIKGQDFTSPIENITSGNQEK